MALMYRTREVFQPLTLRLVIDEQLENMSAMLSIDDVFHLDTSSEESDEQPQNK